MTKQEVIEKIKGFADKADSFKIGKTSQSIADRFETEYQEGYKEIVGICSSPSKKAIDDLEYELVEYFLADKDYKDKCDNVHETNIDMGEAQKYRVYVVYD
jgi:hypothetical protein